MLLKDKKVAIIGAGPVGLTMAKLLQQKGVTVTVYEWDKNAETRIWGGTLDLHQGSGQEAMRKAGLLKNYYAMAIPMGRTVVDQNGKTLFTKETTPKEEHNNPEINRNDLRQLLLNSLAPDTVIWDSKFTELSAQKGQWQLHFENEMDATADLVIGANGGMSKVRNYLTDARIEDTGTMIIQGEVNQPDLKCSAFYQLCNHKILMAANNGTLLVANPKNKNALSYNVMFKMPEDWVYGSGLNFEDANSVINFLSNRLAHWHESYQQLFRSTSFFVGLPTRKIPLDQPWKATRPLPITLIGDAAHIMPPFAGQGVNTGLMDTLILSDYLTSEKFETITAATNAYEKQMFVYATAAQLQTSTNEIAMHDPNFSFLDFMKR